eukprot:1585748-Rhodomonas_salina.1
MPQTRPVLLNGTKPPSKSFQTTTRYMPLPTCAQSALHYQPQTCSSTQRCVWPDLRVLLCAWLRRSGGRWVSLSREGVWGRVRYWFRVRGYALCGTDIAYGAALSNLASLRKSGGSYDEALRLYKTALEVGTVLGWVRSHAGSSSVCVSARCPLASVGTIAVGEAASPIVSRQSRCTLLSHCLLYTSPSPRDRG